MRWKEEITELVEKERSYSDSIHSDKIASTHEAYALIKEEIEEVKDDLFVVERMLDEFWSETKQDVSGEETLQHGYQWSLMAIEEFIQVANLFKKAYDTLYINKKTLE